MLSLGAIRQNMQKPWGCRFNFIPGLKGFAWTGWFRATACKCCQKSTLAHTVEKETDLE
jgi:hypothetical protein